MHIAVIPAYEPDGRLLSLLQEAEQFGFDLLVVDDGSGERYSPLFALARRYAHVISYPANHGKGYAMKQAFSYLQAHYRGDYTVVLLDCDGQHRVQDAWRLCQAAQARPEALFLGSRRQSAASPLRSRVGNAVTRTVYRLTTGQRVYDTQTGLRACSSRLLALLLSIPGDRYEYEMNMLLQCARSHVPIEELPIQTIYLDNNAGSHFHTVRDSWRIYRQILAFSASSLASFGVDYGLFSLLTLLTGGTMVVAANVAARLVSATVNFTVNRCVVFRDRGAVWHSALRYAALAAAILLCNTLLLYGLTTGLGWNPYVAKLTTELTLFVCSWLVQRKWIFRHKEDVPSRA